MVIADFPPKLEFLFQPNRYKAVYSGRAAGKSWAFARALLILAIRRRRRILCCRELQRSIEDSVHELLRDQIGRLSIGDFYDVQHSTIAGQNGSEFIFAGLRNNPEKVRSMEGIDIAWIEEAQNVSDVSFEIIIPTIRNPGSEIWISFNPDLETDSVYRRFIADCPPNAKVVKISWRDNPWLPRVMREEKDYLFRIDPEAAAHVWDGELRRNSEACVLRGRYVIESFEPDPKEWDGPYLGADWGFGISPTALVMCWVHGRKLYVEHEAYGIGVDLDDTPALFDTVPNARKYTIRADSSRPETISHMRRHGYTKVIATVKGKGSVEDGVEHLRSYEKIIIHPRCIHTAEEARLWSYKVDRGGNILPILAEKHCHIWDGARYALSPIIRSGKPRRQPPVPPPKKRDYGWRNKPIKRGAWKTI